LHLLESNGIDTLAVILPEIGGATFFAILRWPPKYLRSRGRHENRGWVEIVGAKVVEEATENRCRDSATMTCSLLDYNGTDSPFLILKEFFDPAYQTQIGSTFERIAPF